MRPTVAVVAVAALVIAFAIALQVVRYEAPTGAIVPSPTTAPATTTPGPTASPSPSPRPTTAATAVPPAVVSGGTYVSGVMGYAMDLRPPWHRATCGSSASGPNEGNDGGDLFIAVPDRDFRFGDVGPNADNIQVFARANPSGLSYRDWKRQHVGGSASETLQDVTFAGRPALLVTTGSDELFLVSSGGYMYQVAHYARRGDTSRADRAAIVRSFRFLSAEEIRVARAAATPSPAPRTVAAVADVLAEGFAKKDVTILARVISPRCVSQGAAQAGATSMDPETYLAMLRERFARGLTVDVAPRPIATRSEAGGVSAIRAVWREPGQADQDTDLVIAADRGTAYWTGTITYFRR